MRDRPSRHAAHGKGSRRTHGYHDHDDQTDQSTVENRNDFDFSFQLSLAREVFPLLHWAAFNFQLLLCLDVERWILSVGRSRCLDPFDFSFQLSTFSF